MNYPVTSPTTKDEWLSYYHLRWEVLRKPWQQPKGSEKDELEYSSHHCMIQDELNHVIAVGRLHFIDNDNAQIRYMAVNPEYQKRGLGHQILHALENAARKNAISTIRLHARENAVGFYEKHGYACIQPSHLLYNSIQHFFMAKQLTE